MNEIDPRIGATIEEAELVDYGRSWPLTEEAIRRLGDRIYECESSHAGLFGFEAAPARVFHVRPHSDLSAVEIERVIASG